MIHRVSDILPKIGRYVDGAGVDPECEPGRQLAIDALNRATYQLMDEGDWDGARAEICIEVSGCCFTLDEEFQTIIAANPRLSGPPLKIRHRNFKFVDSGTGESDCCGSSCLRSMNDLGDGYATHKDLPKAMHIMAYSDREEAEGARLEIRGDDSEGKDILHCIPLRHHHGQDGKSPAFTPPAGDWFTDGKLVSISELRKAATCGYIYVFGYDPETQETCWLTTIRPESMSPCHRRYQFPEAGEGIREVVCQVSLRYHDVQRDEDVVLIQNPEALRGMIQAHAASDMDDPARYGFHKNRAIMRLKKQKGKNARGSVNRFQVRMGGSPLKGANFQRRRRR